MATVEAGKVLKTDCHTTPPAYEDEARCGGCRWQPKGLLMAAAMLSVVAPPQVWTLTSNIGQMVLKMLVVVEP